MTRLSVMIATIRMVAPHAREQRVDLVDAADQLGPALPEQLALGRIGLGANRRTDGDTPWRRRDGRHSRAGADCRRTLSRGIRTSRLRTPAVAGDRDVRRSGGHDPCRRFGDQRRRRGYARTRANDHPRRGSGRSGIVFWRAPTSRSSKRGKIDSRIATASGAGWWTGRWRGIWTAGSSRTASPGAIATAASVMSW